MNVILPRPIRESKETVTLSRSDWEALVEFLEDAEDAAAVADRKAREAAVGVSAARRDYLTGDELRRLVDWESPLRVWREKRGLSQRALARQARVSPSYLAEIETGQKPGSADALLNIARVLNIPMESLVSSNRLQIAFEHLRQCVESRATEAAAGAEGQRVIAALRVQGVTDFDLDELKTRLRNLASGYQAAGRTLEDNALTAIIRESLT